MYFKLGKIVEQDEKVFMEWLEKAANQNNPWAMECLGYQFQVEEKGNDKEKAFSYHHAAADLGWKKSMHFLAYMLSHEEGCEKDLRMRLAVIWLSKGSLKDFWNVLGEAKQALESDRTKDLNWDFNQLCYTLGWGLYWYKFGTVEWNKRTKEEKAFDNGCLDYYCWCVELQQKSIFTFLLCWNRRTGIKGPGQMIAQMVWEQREDNLVDIFEQSDGEEPEVKRIKK
jgi:hypothetical protein